VSCLLVVGAGGHGKVVAEAAIASGTWREVAFLDSRFPELRSVLDWRVVGDDRDVARHLAQYPEIFVAIGDNRARVERLRVCLESGFRAAIIVHPRAWVSPSAHIGPGVIVVGGAIVNACASLGRGCIVNTGATVDHDCELADGVHISPGAHVGGGSSIGECTWIGIGAAIRHGVRIGADVMVGAGAAVVDDLPSGVRAHGVPARVA